MKARAHEQAPQPREPAPQPAAETPAVQLAPPGVLANAIALGVAPQGSPSEALNNPAESSTDSALSGVEGRRRRGSPLLHLSRLGAGAPLPFATLRRMEATLGGDLSVVRVHTDAAAARFAAHHGALAVTEGQHVAFASGWYAPGTAEGEALLAHELAHARQQQGAGPTTGSDTVLEREANRAGFIAALRLFDPERAAALGAPPLSRTGLRLQRCAPPDYSEIGALPTREEYERRGELMPRLVVRGRPDLALFSPGLVLGAAPATAPAEPQPGAEIAAHPSPIPESFGASAAEMSPELMAMRLEDLQADIAAIERLVTGEYATDARVAGMIVSRQAAHQASPEYLYFVIEGEDPSASVPSEPQALSREIVRAELAVTRIHDALGELATSQSVEETTGRRMASASHSSPQYDVDAALSEIDTVRWAYMQALLMVLTPRQRTRFNDADAAHGQLGPSLTRRKLDYYSALTSTYPELAGSTQQINAWAADLQTQLEQLEEAAPRLRAARESRSEDLPWLESEFVARADFIAVSIEALGEWDMALQAYEYLAGNSALTGFAGVDAIAARLSQMRDAAIDQDTEYLKLLLRDHRADARVTEYFRSLPTIVRWSQFIIMLGITLIAAVASAGVGIAAGAAAGAGLAALGVAEGSMLMVGGTFLAQVGAEALVFTALSRALQSAFPGMGPTSPFWVDFLWNFGLFAVMRGAAMGLRSALRPLSSLARFAVSHTVSFGILQSYGILRFTVEAGRLPTESELVTMTGENLIMMVGLTVGMKAFEPMLAPLEQASQVARLRRAFGPRFAEFEVERARLAEDARSRMESNPEAIAEDIADLRSRAEDLDGRLRALVEEVMGTGDFDPFVLRREVSELLGRVARTPLPELLRGAGFDPSFDVLPTGRDGSWSFPRGRADAFIASLRAAGYEVVGDLSTAVGRVIDAAVPGQGIVRFIERPSAERVVVPVTEADVSAARARMVAEEEAGGTRGRGVYPLEARVVQTPARVTAALREVSRSLAGEGLRVEGVRTGDGGASGTLRVDVPATDSAPAVSTSVPIEVAVVPEVSGTVHGEATGHARLVISGDASSGWRVRVEVDGRLRTDGDVEHNLRHELREAGFILGELSRNPRADVRGEQRARVFAEGSETSPSAHDRAAARELADLFAEARRSLQAVEEARAEARRGGARVSRTTRTAGDLAVRRLDALLDAMGFRDPATRAAKQRALLELLGLEASSPLARFVEGYGGRVEAAVRRRAAFDRLTVPQREALAEALGRSFATYLTEGLPDAAVDPLNQAVQRLDPANPRARTALRDLLTRHRDGALSDAELLAALDAQAAWVPPRSWNGPSRHGRWTGARGNSGWIDARPEVRRVVGNLPNGEPRPVPFREGVVDFSRWVQRVLDVPGLIGEHRHDMPLIREAIANALDLAPGESRTARAEAALDYLRDAPDGYGGTGLAPHHAGGTRVELVPLDLHRVQHTDLAVYPAAE